jgi:hypothetical protein
MSIVSDPDSPALDYTAPDFTADRYHQQLAETRQPGLPKVNLNHGPAPDV